MIDVEDRERLERASQILHELWDTVLDYRINDKIYKAMIEVDETLANTNKYSRDTW